MSNVKQKSEELISIHEQIVALQKRRRAIFATSEGDKVRDYTFKRPNGADVKLSQLFGDGHELMLVHNMGRRCNYCTLWADGFNGVWKHLDDRAAFVVVSPDQPEVQDEFAKSRNWGFPMASCAGTSFTKDMNMEENTGEYWPGISTFTKEKDGTILRRAYTYLGPGDPFCPVWHIFDMLPQGENDWNPKDAY